MGGSTDALDLFFAEREQPHLGGGSSDFVRKIVPRRHARNAPLLADGAGESTLFMAEKLAVRSVSG
jgi:hypothetical protein